MSPADAIAAIEAIEAEPGFRTNGGQSSNAKDLIRALPATAFIHPIALTVERVDDAEVAVTLANRDQGCNRSLRFVGHGYSGFQVDARPDPETIPVDAWTWGRPGTVMVGLESTPQVIASLFRWLWEG